MREASGNEPTSKANGPTLVLLRHGQSELNRQHRFTGWNDAPLTSEGEAEAARAGELLQQSGFVPHAVFVSQLTRAIRTCEIVCARLQSAALTPHRDWRLNERHYGDLEGLGILQGLRRYGPLPLLRCRRQWQQRPPLMDAGDARFPGRDPRYADIAGADLPRGESFADVHARLEPFFRQEIAPALLRERSVLVVSHKNTIHILLMLLAQIPLAEAQRITVATATPIVLDLDNQLRVLRRHELR